MRWGEIERFEHRGHTLLVKRLGTASGPQFVLVHGIGVASRYYKRLARQLAMSGGVHTVELPGHGAAPEPRESMLIGDFAELIGSYLEARGLSRPVAVGHSMGAQVVTELALQQPDRVQRVVLMGTVVDPRERNIVTLALRLLQDSFCEPPSVNWIVFSDYLRCGPRWFVKTIPAMTGYNTSEALPRLRADALVVRGMRDPIGRHDWGVRMTELIPRARLIELPRAGHVVMHTAAHDVARQIVFHAEHGISQATDGTRAEIQ